MKTTIEIPDSVFRRAKAKAAERGQALRAFVTGALQEKLSGRPAASGSNHAPWMKGFGQLRPLQFEIVVHRGAGAYICGEETGLLSSLEGAAGLHRRRRQSASGYRLKAIRHSGHRARGISLRHLGLPAP